MSKRALSPSPHSLLLLIIFVIGRDRGSDGVLASSCCTRCPPPCFAKVCSFLSVYQVVSTLRSACHAHAQQRHSRVPAAVSSRHPEPLAPRTRRLHARHSRSGQPRAVSLTLLYQLELRDDDTLDMELLPLQELRSPQDACPASCSLP